MARPTFTLAQYLRYKEMPDWQRDNSDWTDKKQYAAHWTETIKDWKGQSESEYKKTKEVWKLCWDLFDNPKRSGSNIGNAPSDAAIAGAQIDILQNAAYDKVAMLWSNFPIPVYTPVQESENAFISLANQFKDIELKNNDFNTMGFDLGLDQFFCDMCLLKVYTVPEEGVFNQDEKIVIEQADPFKFWPDPRATRMKWAKSSYWIYESEMELGEVHDRFPGSYGRVKASQVPSDSDGSYGTHLKTLLPQKPNDSALKGRDIVHIVECWFKDYRETFEAEWEDVQVPDGEGGMKLKPQVKIDDSGKVVGTWERAYPNGRCIVITDDGVVLSDYENPLWHDGAPFIPIPVRPGSRRKQLRPGEALSILRLHYKINDCEERYHRMAQNEIERPLLAETGTFPTPRSWYKTSKMAEAILVKNPGKEFMRMPPTETPVFTEQYVARLNSYVDRTSGISAVMRGQLAEGSQISAEGMSSLQGFASSRLKMQAELIAAGMKELGVQLFWLIRQTYPSGIQCQVTKADGTVEPVAWNERGLNSAYMVVDIDSNSGLPGGQAAAASDAVMMWDKKLVDRAYTLQAKKVPGWQGIDQRMRSDRLAQITAAAAGRAVGVGIKQFEKADEEPGRTQAQ